MIENLLSNPIFGLIGKLPNAKEIFLVGGSVRDMFLGREVTDLDFACKDGIATGRALANQNGFDFYILDRERDCCRVIQTLADGTKVHYDINGLRAPTIENDLRDRDFTINAMAINIVDQKLVDPTAGLMDLRNKVLKACSHSTIHNDPLRALRAVRFSVSLGLRIDADVLAQIRTVLPSLERVSAERIRDELFKIFATPKPALAIELLDKLGILPLLFPKLSALKGLAQPAPHVNDAWVHTIGVVRHLSAILAAACAYDEEKANADLFTGLLVLKLGKYRHFLRDHFEAERSEGRNRRTTLVFTALFHDVEKPSCRTEEQGRIRFLGHDTAGALTIASVAEGLRLSTSETYAASKIVGNHMRIHGLVNRKDEGFDVSDRAIYRYYRALGIDGIDLLLLSLADLRATFEHTLPQDKWRNGLDVVEQFLNAWVSRQSEVISPPVLINGHMLMKDLGIGPGGLLGTLLEAVREDQAAGSIKTTDQALAFCRQKLASIKAQDEPPS